MKRQHLRQRCQEPLGFILAWPRKILWKRTRGPRALWSAVNQLQPGDCQVLQWFGSALQSRLGGDYQPDPLSLEPEMTQTSQTARACQGGWQWALERVFSPSLMSLPASCCCGRFWTVYSLWGNINSLATSKYLNSFKTTGIQQRKGKYPFGASVN